MTLATVPNHASALSLACLSVYDRGFFPDYASLARPCQSDHASTLGAILLVAAALVLLHLQGQQSSGLQAELLKMHPYFFEPCTHCSHLQGCLVLSRKGSLHVK